MSSLTGFSVFGLFRRMNVSIELSEDVLIVVGPNGIGKSTSINLLYYVVTQQWRRVLDFTFDAIEITFADTQFRFDRLSIEYSTESRRNIGSLDRYVEKLSIAGELDSFLRSKKLSPENTRKYSALLSVSELNVSRLQRDLIRYRGEDLFGVEFTRFSTYLRSWGFKILYLPTYRMIERELKAILPRIEDEYRTRYQREMRLGQRSDHYIELVNFGMEDVKTVISTHLATLDSFGRSQLNTLAGDYLSDVIHDKPSKFSKKSISTLSEAEIERILGVVNDSSLSQEEKLTLKSDIIEIQKPKRGGYLKLHHRYLLHYFQKLREAADKIALQCKSVNTFVQICNLYLGGEKYFIFNEATYELKLLHEAGEEIDISSLSSGEKQIVSIFTHVLLENESNYFIIIDEPELSLSVLWQERFLADLYSTGNVSKLVAVTHSPFIYSNNLVSSVRDFSNFVERIK